MKYIISFRTFKQNCSHLNKDYDFNKHECYYGHGTEELFTIHPQTDERIMYEPCMEKYCPILNKLKIAQEDK